MHLFSILIVYFVLKRILSNYCRFLRLSDMIRFGNSMRGLSINLGNRWDRKLIKASGLLLLSKMIFGLRMKTPEGWQ